MLTFIAIRYIIKEGKQIKKRESQRRKRMKKKIKAESPYIVWTMSTGEEYKKSVKESIIEVLEEVIKEREEEVIELGYAEIKNEREKEEKIKESLEKEVEYMIKVGQRELELEIEEEGKEYELREYIKKLLKEESVVSDLYGELVSLGRNRARYEELKELERMQVSEYGVYN